jgi:putative heme-binding domain-containing protein
VGERNLEADGDPADALNKMISSSHAALQSNALSLAGLWQVRGTADAVESIAGESGAVTAVRRAAFIAMARMGLDGADKTLNQLAAKPNTTPLRAAAIEALCLIETESAAKHAATLFAGVKGATLNPTPVLNSFLSREGGCVALANALGATKMEAAFAGHVLQSLYATGRNDEKLIAVLKKSAGISGKGQPYSLALVQNLVADSKTQGDAARGKALSAACIACHKFGEVGGVIGPDLTAIGTTLSADRITEELLWPSRQVKEGYTLLQVTTKDGKLHQGFERRTKESEKTGDLVMRQLAIDVIVTIKKDQIASVQKLGSAMPAGLTTAMTRQQQLDLIQYLSSLSGEPMKE